MISFKRYVDITSGVGGSGAVRLRDLIGRLYTTNPLVPTKGFIELNSLEEVASYFGSTSVEYARAVFYFGFIAKNISRAKKISFARWVDAAVAPRIFGAKANYALGAFTAITNGALTMTIGGVTNTMNTLNFSGAASLAAVAAIIQTAIRTKTGTQWTAATVTYDAVRQSFQFEGGQTGAADISVTVGGANDISLLIGWGPGAILSFGSGVETITDTLNLSTEASNNFGSFAFIPTLTTAQILEAAQWNDAQNVMFIYCVPVTSLSYAAIQAAVIGQSGVALTLAPISTEYPEMIPMIILAATDYTRRNSVQNYMYQIFSITPSVTTNADANLYDPLRINYYGRTQTAGQIIQFYQRGVMTGLAVDPSDQNVYANEIWLKDAAAGAIMTLLLSLQKVSANARGRSQIMTALQAGPIEQALFNGTISVGKDLNTTQKLFINEITGDDRAWIQVQNIGYWLDVVFGQVVTQSGAIEFEARYTLVYSKDDTIKKVQGSHILI